MSPRIKPSTATILVTFGVGVAAAAVAGLIPGVADRLPFSPPASIVWVLPFLDLGQPFTALLVLFALLAAPVGMVVWHVGLLSGSDEYPRRSSVLAGIVAATSILYYLRYW